MDNKSKAFYLLAESQSSGQAFFNTAVEALALAVASRWVGIALLRDDHLTVDVIAFWDKNKLGQLLTYQLPGTPCETVYQTKSRQQYCYIPDAVTERFPEDQTLRNLGACSYQGGLFFNNDDTPAGHVFLLDDKERLFNPDNDIFFRIVCQRVEAEYNRWSGEKKFRASEQRLQDFAQASSDWFWETDDKHCYTWISAEVQHITGLPQQWFYGKSRQEAAQVDSSQEHWQQHLATIQTHKPFRDFEYQRSDVNENGLWIRVSGIPVFDEQNHFQGYRGCASDITHIHHSKKLIAECVENQATLEILQSIGVDFVQGFVIDTPKPIIPTHGAKC